MKIFNKIKNKLGMVALFGLLFQLTMPIYETYVFAQGESVVETLTTAETIEEDNNNNEETFIEDGDSKIDHTYTEKILETKSETEEPEIIESIDEDKNTEQSEELKDEGDTTEKKEENTEDSVSNSTEGAAEESALELEVKGEPQQITENIINDMKLKDKNGIIYEEGKFIEVGDDLSLDLDWSLPNGHGYINSDYFEFRLPEKFAIHNSLDGPLGDYGTFTVDAKGNAKFVFNEKIEQESNIKGTFSINTELKASEITTTKETIELIVNGIVVQKIAVNVKPTEGQAINKKGQPVNGNFNTEEVEWTVVVNTARDSLKNAVIDDEILTGQELMLDSLVIKEVEVNSKGEVIKGSEKDTTYQKNNSTIGNLNIELGDTNKAYKLTFKTKLLEKDFKEGTTNYKNTAYLKSDGNKDAQAGGSVSVSRPKSIEKTSKTFDKEDRSIEWTVNANFTEQSLKKGDVITDEFTFTVKKEEVTDVFVIKPADIEILQVNEFNETGKPIETSNAKELFDITIEGNKVTYKLKEASNKAFILKYKTELKDGAYINKDGKITNKVDLNGKIATGSQGVIQQIGKKTNAGINYKDKTIDWTITVNADKQDLRNFILTDSFSESGQKLVEDSIEINPAVDSDKVTVNSDNKGFKINFGDIKETYTIKYQTKFRYDFKGKETPSFKNGVKITYDTSNGSDYELGFGNEVKPNKETKSNGAKNGSANNETKEITWEIDINYNQLSLKDAKVEDTIPNNQMLIGDVEIYETSIAKNGKITVDKEATDDFTIESNKNQVNVTFGRTIDKSYRIVFRTKDKDGIYNEGEVYQNTAKFIPREDEVHNLTANVTLPNQGAFIGKTGKHNKEDWTLDWKIDVNKSLSTTADFTVTDDLGDPSAQILLEDTIKVTKAGSTDELVEGEDYSLTIDGNKFKIYFPGVITESYVITYSSYIVAEKDSVINNDAKIESNDVIKGTTTGTEKITVKISTGDGTGEGTTGGLVLEKFEADSERALKEVPFNLVKIIGNKEIVVREGSTNAEGKLEWSGLQYGDYTLKEEVPEGYLGNAEQKVTISGKDPKGIKTLLVENTRKTGKAKIIKVDAHTGETIKGAKFRITNQTTGQKYEFETDKDGVALEEVPYGDYTVEEIVTPAGYRATKDIENITVKIDKTTTIEVENVAFVDIPVQKTWYVDKDKQLPKAIKVHLLRNGQKTNQSITLNASNKWEDSFKNLDKYTAAHKEIKYTIEEEAVDGYIVEQDGYNLTNIQITDISVKKNWVDDNNPDRPTSVKVQLYADDKALAGKVVTLSNAADDVTKDWTHTFSGLPKYSNTGKRINYTVKEVEIPKNYESKVEDYEITNLRKATTAVKGEKIWKDEESTDRPAEIKVNLARRVKDEMDNDFNETLTVKPNSKGEWKYTFEELDQFDEHGAEYTYIVKEENVPKGYESLVDGHDIINIRVGKTEVSGTKRWKDDKTDDRPKSITVNLLRNNVVIQTTDVTAEDNWKYSFTKLDKYDDEGKYYKYTVKEEQVPGYAPKVTGEDITNTRSGKTNFEITKGWLDDHSENRPDSIIVYVYQNNELFNTVKITASESWTYNLTNLEAFDKDGQPYTYTIKEKPLTEKDSIDQYKSTVNGFNITNLRVGKTEVTGEKIWEEVDKQYRPDSIKVNLLANGEKFKDIEVSGKTNWKYTFKDLAKYDDQGKEINYTIEEVEIPSGYQSIIDGHNIINTQMKTEIVGQKLWLDDNNSERPTSVRIDLLANGEKTNKSLKVSTSTNWEYRFADIPKYDKAGKEIKYSVAEEAVKGYKTLIKDFNVINLRIGTIEINGEKKWKDVGPGDRPESIEVILTRNVKGVLDSSFEQELTVTPDLEGKWSYTFGDLPEFDEEGQAYTYTVKEESEPAGYESSVEGYDITNLRVGTVTLSGNKTWKDDKTTDRPDSITINLLRNNIVIDTKVVVQPLDPVYEWTYTFTDLAEFDEEGIAYEYRVSEQDVPGYAAEFSEMDITNTRSEKKTIAITKGWLDDNEKDRPKSIKVDVYQNDLLFKTVKVKASENWIYELEDLEAYDENGQAYTYTIKEHMIKGYKSTIDGFNIKNLRVGETKIIGKKIWKEVDEQYRPDSIKINLLANGEMVKDVDVSGKTNWKYAFRDLAKYDDQGKEINYTIEEVEIPAGYQSVVNGHNIINTQIKTEVVGQKVWLDDNNPERPTSVRIDLLANGEKTNKSLEVSGKNDWRYRFTDIPKYDKAGKEIKYSVVEEAVKGYKTLIEDFIITNLRIGRVEVNGEKKWKDAGPKDRPESIIVILTRKIKDTVDQDFEKHLIVTPNSDGNWEYTFKHLPEFNEEGKAYTYEVKEKSVPTGYESSVDGYDITNIRVGTVNLSGNKTWKDDKPTDRPDSITVNLLRNHSVVATKVVQASDSDTTWEYIFTNLQEFDENGIRYDYRVSEEDVPGYAAKTSGMNIINTRSDKKSIKITKGWLDEYSEDRPKSIKVDVYQNNELFKTVKVRAADNWIYELKDLEAYDENGKGYTYTIKEREVKGYESLINGFNITNLRKGQVNITGEKIWKDEGSAERPKSIEVLLTREVNGEKDSGFIQTEIVTPDFRDKWRYSFDNLEEFDEKGKAYNYIVEEKEVPEGYESLISGYNLINLRVGKTKVNIIKNWENDKKQNRPMSIEVDLRRNGKLFKSVILSKESGWMYSFADLEEFDSEGKAYTYTIHEKPVKGYEASLEKTSFGFELTNTYVTPNVPVKPSEPNIPVTPDKPQKSEKPDYSEKFGLPKTGEMRNTGLYLIGGLIILIGLILGKKRIEE